MCPASPTRAVPLWMTDESATAKMVEEAIDLAAEHGDERRTTCADGRGDAAQGGMTRSPTEVTADGRPRRPARVLPVRGIGDVTAGDDLAAMITSAAPWLRDGDVLVVTSKIVSKAEGRLVDVPADGPEREAARAEVLAAETARVVARRGPTAIVQTHHGFVMAAAGIDASNVDKTHLVLLPARPGRVRPARCAAALAERGLRVGVIVSDTMGRAWRNGLTDVALGAAGIEPFRDHRRRDRSVRQRAAAHPDGRDRRAGRGR